MNSLAMMMMMGSMNSNGSDEDGNMKMYYRKSIPIGKNMRINMGKNGPTSTSIKMGKMTQNIKNNGETTRSMNLGGGITMRDTKGGSKKSYSLKDFKASIRRDDDRGYLQFKNKATNEMAEDKIVRWFQKNQSEALKRFLNKKLDEINALSEKVESIKSSPIAKNEGNISRYSSLEDVEDRINFFAEIFQELEFPLIELLDVSIGFEDDFADSDVVINIQFPKLEEIPTVKAKREGFVLHYGEKTDKKIKSEYIEFIFGVVVNLVGSVFNNAESFSRVTVSGYREEFDSTTGEKSLLPILHVKFPRGTYNEIQFQNVNILKTMERFDAEFEIDSKHIVKNIPIAKR